jgi:DNA-directed RNA polymerase specialized sigma24 family protein
MNAGAAADSFDFEAVFHSHYRRVARVILRVIQDPSRAEELAVEVFW